MVLMSTKFYVTDEFTPEIFTDMLNSWAPSVVSGLKAAYDGSAEYEVKSRNGKSSLKVYRSEGKVAAQLVAAKQSSVHTYTFILSRQDKKPVFFVSLSKDLLVATKKVQPELEVPRLMRSVLWEEYGAIDCNICTDDKPFIIRRTDIEMAKKIVTCKGKYLNPVVYVSPYEASGAYAVNCDELASLLIGTAHVVAEANPYVSKLVAEASDKKNPKDGSLGVYLPSGEYKEFHPSDGDLAKQVSDYVLEIMASVIPGDEFSFQKIRYDAKLQKAIELSGGNEELEQLYNEVLDEKDVEVKNLQAEVESLRKQLDAATHKAESLQAALDKKDNGVRDICLACSEKPLYDHELEDVVIKLAKSEAAKMKDDKKAGGSRKMSVLQAIIDSNQLSGKEQEIRKMFKEHVKSGTIDVDRMSELERLGFMVAAEGGKHYKITFSGDSRYQGVFSKTPSDYRAGENIASSYMNMLFGY